MGAVNKPDDIIIVWIYSALRYNFSHSDTDKIMERFKWVKELGPEARSAIYYLLEVA